MSSFQVDNRFSAFWMDTTTAPGTPLIGLSATITIRDINGNVVVNNLPMTELGGGHYTYVYSAMNMDMEYVYTMNPGVGAYIESGVTNNTLFSVVSQLRARGGGGLVDMGAIKNTINDAVKNNTPNYEEIVHDIKSAIDAKTIDFSSVSDKIDSIKIPKGKDYGKSLLEIKKQIDDLSKFIKEEAKKELEENDAEHSEKLRQHEEMMQQMEESYKMLEEITKEEVDKKEEEKTALEEEADKLIDILEKEIEDASEAGKQEIVDKLKTITQ